MLSGSWALMILMGMSKSVSGGENVRSWRAIGKVVGVDSEITVLALRVLRGYR